METEESTSADQPKEPKTDVEDNAVLAKTEEAIVDAKATNTIEDEAKDCSEAGEAMEKEEDSKGLEPADDDVSDGKKRARDETNEANPDKSVELEEPAYKVEKIEQEPATAEDAVAAEDMTTKSSASAQQQQKQKEQQVAAVSAASAAAAAQLCASMGFHGLYSVLSTTITSSTPTSSAGMPGSSSGGSSSLGAAGNGLPTLEQVQQAAIKSVQECPPFVHLSKTDSAPQLKIVDDRRLTVKGGMRGYRMARATHGISAGNYYYEVLILDPPPVSEIVASLPPNARMGKTLQAQVQQALLEEQQGLPKTSSFGGHVRLGWSMRTGDLQAPVGYDKWSFAIRDIGGSKIHCSRREDNWGGEDFGPGDVVGCAICLHDPKKDPQPEPQGQQGDKQGDKQQPLNNHVRFFKNGQPMGQFVISKGKREGGIAFSVPSGVYYPAISLYMGASVKVNLGPHFIYQPRKLPAGLKLHPVSDLCKSPVSIEEALAKVQKEKAFRKPDMNQTFLDLVQAEAKILQDSYQNHRKKHVQEVRQEREKRGLNTSDLETEGG